MKSIDVLMSVVLVLWTVIALRSCDAKAEYVPPPVDEVFPIPDPASVFLTARVIFHETGMRYDAPVIS